MSLVGQQLGPYHLLRPIGSGGMGEVYLAEDIHLRRQVAIKVIRAEATAYTDESTAKEAARLFQREARAIAILDHPHILPLFTYGEEKINDTVFTYLVMPFRQEGSLVNWLHQLGNPRLLSPQDVEHIVSQAADALEYAHRHQIIHQDVKPSNFLIRHNPNIPNRPDILLADFGIAKLNTATASASQSVRGTPAYMAPEQWEGRPVFATDQYALAIMTYELLVGRPPFQGGMGQVMFQHFQAQPEPPSLVNPRLPKDIDTVLLHALAKKPQERFASISAFARAFQQAARSSAFSNPTQPANPPIMPSSNPTQPVNPTFDTLNSVVPPYVSQSGIPTYISPQSTDPYSMQPGLPPYISQEPASSAHNLPPYVVPPVTPPFEPQSAWSGLLSSPNIGSDFGGRRIATGQRGPSRGLVLLLVTLAILTVVGSLLYFVRPLTLLNISLQNGSHSTVVPNGPHSTAVPKALTSQQVFSYAPSTGSDILTFDPAVAYDYQSVAAIEMVFTGLVQLDDKQNVQAQLAQSYDRSSDGLTYTFHLRQNLKFSDGSSLTSRDVAYSIDRALSPSVSNLSGVALIYLGLINDSDKRTQGKISTLINDSILTPDDNTVVFKLNKPGAYFLQALAYPTSFVVEKSLIDKYGEKFTDHLTEGGGDGPFKVARYDHNTGIDFVPNPNYYGPQPQLQKVSFPFFKDNSISYQAYLNGQINMTTVPLAHIADAKTRADFHQEPTLTIDYFAMNYLTRPFDNIKIRQAFALAINKDTLIKSAYGNEYIPTNHIVPEGLTGYNSHVVGPAETQGTSGNPTLAKTLLQEGLQEEGYTNVTQLPPITLIYSDDSVGTVRNEMTLVVAMWQQVLGITVRANSVDFAKLITEIDATTNNANGLQLWYVAWAADYPDPQDFLTFQFGKGSVSNNLNYGQNHVGNASQQQQVQQQLEQADVNQDPKARMQAYNVLEQQLVNDVAWLPIDQRATNILISSYVEGFVLNSENIVPPNDWGNIYIGAH